MPATTKRAKTGPLRASFSAKLRRTPKAGSWTYVVWPKSVGFFGTRGLVKVEGRIDGVPFKPFYEAYGRYSVYVRVSYE